MDTGVRDRNLEWNASIVWSSQGYRPRDISRGFHARSVQSDWMSAAHGHKQREFDAFGFDVHKG
jgi:hypothetical protein